MLLTYGYDRVGICGCRWSSMHHGNRCPEHDCTFIEVFDMTTPNTPQPSPKPGEAVATWDLVRADIAERDKAGEKKYGVRHQHDNGRDHLIDAYQEALDLVVYLRAEIERRKELEVEVKRLQGIIEGLAARVHAQSELLSKRAEKISEKPAESAPTYVVPEWWTRVD